MTTEITSKIINSVGLFCDIAGAWLVAWEVVRQYKGKTHGTGFAATDKNNPKQYTQTVYEMPDYRKYQTNKYTKMKLGLAFLTIGFLLQFVSNWVYLVDRNKEQQKTTQETNNPINPITTQRNDSKPPAMETIQPKTPKPRPDK